MPIQGLNPDPATDPNAQEPGGGPPQDLRPLTRETLWEAYGEQAINSVYPDLKNGVDFAWGRPADDPAGTARLLGVREGVTIDEGKIKEAAQKLADADPNVEYLTKPSLHSGSVKEPTTQDDVDRAKAQSDLPNPDYGTPQ